MYLSAGVVIFLLVCSSFACLLELSQIKSRYMMFLVVSGIPEFSTGGAFQSGEQCYGLIDCVEKICVENTTFTPFVNYSCGGGKENYTDRIPGWAKQEYKEFEDFLLSVLALCIVYPCVTFTLFGVYCTLKYYGQGTLRLKTYVIASTVVAIFFSLACCVSVIVSSTRLNQFEPQLPEFASDELYYSQTTTTILLSIQVVIISITLVYSVIYQKDLDVEEYKPLSFSTERKEMIFQDSDEDVYEERKLKEPKIIVIEGNIAVGKSTYINFVVKRLEKIGQKVKVISEPIDLWSTVGVFQKFCADPSRWSYTFQTYAYSTRIQNAIDSYDPQEDYDVYIIERSWFSDRFFMENLHKGGLVSDMEMQMYETWCTLWKSVVPFMPTMFLYLRCSAETSHERCLSRQREGEEEIPLEYLKSLLSIHDRHLSGNQFVADGCCISCHTIDTEEDYVHDWNKLREKIDEFMVLY